MTPLLARQLAEVLPPGGECFLVGGVAGRVVGCASHPLPRRNSYVTLQRRALRRICGQTKKIGIPCMLLLPFDDHSHLAPLSPYLTPACEQALGSEAGKV